LEQAPLKCAECGANALSGAAGWRAYLAGGQGEEDEEATAFLFCPECAEREFD
jgi:Zn finger protein HypA/HybF involved in hydrogenase expression